MGVIDEAITRIRDLIADGELTPGDRLPPEAELAAIVGVSRNSLREAVRALIQANVLDVRRGDGTYVTSLEPQLLLGGLGFVMDLLQDRTLLEVFEVRRLLEPAATSVAAQRVDDLTIVELRASLDRMRAISRVEELVAEDVAFHQTVAAATGNATLCSILDALSTRALRARIWRGISEGGAEVWTLAQHALIVDALARRDGPLAFSAATVHVAASEQWLRHVLEGAEVPAGSRLTDSSGPKLPAVTPAPGTWSGRRAR